MARPWRSEVVATQHLLDHLGQRRRLALDRAGQRVAAQGAEADRALDRHLARRAAESARRRPSGSGRRAPRSGAARRNRAARSRCPRHRYIARCRARSSWRAGRRGCSRPCPCGHCRGPTARAAGSSGPSGAGPSGSEKMRSLARLFSSSRRAPPNAASKPYRSSACLQPFGLPHVGVERGHGRTD